MKDFSPEIKALSERMATLEQHAQDFPIWRTPLTTEAFHELMAALEELRAANDALQQQNAELVSAHQTAQAEDRRYQELFDFAPDGYLVTDSHGVIQEANRAAMALLNARQTDLFGKPLLLFIVGDEHRGFETQLLRLRDGKEAREWEVRVQPRGGTPFPAVCSIAPIREAQGEVVGLRWLLRDMTERKWSVAALRHLNDRLEREIRERTAALANASQELTKRQHVEAQLHASLREKETLLKEIHHRIKNHLQLISSLLALQFHEIGDEQTRDALWDSQQRLKSIALIHEKLYRSDDLARIDLGDYLHQLADNLLCAYAVESDRITLETAIEGVLVDPDTAIHCGLIVLELLSNCLKHAFPEGRSGSIFVTLRRGDSGEVVLTVSNNGIGFPPEFDFQHSESFGLQLVRMLTEQLNGTIRLAQDEGSIVILTFAAGT